MSKFASVTLPAVFQLPPRKLYDVIYADPPWRYDFAKVRKDSIEAHYPPMETDDICKMSVPSAKNSVLYLWTTAPKLREGLRVMEAWGFTYKTQMVWNKDKKGYGHWFMSSHEILMVGVKGRFSPPNKHVRISSVWTEKKRKHSQKPDGIRDAIKSWFPDARRLEMFAREKRDGWDSWGNECEGGVEHPMLPWSLAPNLERLSAEERPWGLFALPWLPGVEARA